MSVMTFEEFIDRTKKEIRDQLPEIYKEADVKMHIVQRPGGGYTGITVELQEQNGAPIINLHEFYKQYLLHPDWNVSLQSMADMIMRFRAVPYAEWIDHYEQAKEKLFLRVCNAGDNEALLEKMVYREYADLALTLHFLYKQEDGECFSIPLTRDLAEEYGIADDDLFRDAFASAETLFPVRFDTMEHILAEMGQRFAGESAMDIKREKTAQTGTLLVTNRQMMHGAAAFFYPGIMKQAAVLMEGSYYILPSSVHEVILLPEECAPDFRELEKMVRHINRSQVLPEDRLSDHVYHYDHVLDLFERADAFVQRKAVRSN